MDNLTAIDSDLFLFLNGLHAEWLDKTMVFITDMWVWMPLYLLLIYWAARQYGKRCTHSGRSSCVKRRAGAQFPLAWSFRM